MTKCGIMEIIYQRNDLHSGARVALDVNGVIYLSRILDMHSNFIYLNPLKRSGLYPNLMFNQPVYLMQEEQEGSIVFVLLRFVQHSAMEGGKDMFRVVRSTFHALHHSALRLSLYGWCELSVFSMFNSARKDFSGKVQIDGLSEQGICLIVPRELPSDTFAECEFRLDGWRYCLPCRATHGQRSENGAYCRMEFSFIFVSQGERLRLRQLLFCEQARRLREA